MCLPFVIRCHLAVLAVQSLLSPHSHAHHEYDSTFAAASFLIGRRVCLSLAPRLPLPLLLLVEPIHINEAGLSVLFYICLWYWEALEQEGGLQA